jgi:hypothetical protein
VSDEWTYDFTDADWSCVDDDPLDEEDGEPLEWDRCLAFDTDYAHYLIIDFSARTITHLLSNIDSVGFPAPAAVSAERAIHVPVPHHSSAADVRRALQRSAPILREMHALWLSESAIPVDPRTEPHRAVFTHQGHDRLAALRQALTDVLLQVS